MPQPASFDCTLISSCSGRALLRRRRCALVLAGHRRGENLVAQVEGLDMLSQRSDEVDARVECPGQRSARIADAHAAHSAGNYDNAPAQS